MRHSRQNSVGAFASPVLGAALLLGGCSMEKLADLTPNTNFSSFEWNPYSKASTMVVAPQLNRPPAAPADYVNQDGSCAGGTPDEAANAPVTGVSLQMTECAVVQMLGMPERIEISSNDQGERTATILYSTGDRPGRYYFTAGRLSQIERVAEPAPPPKPQKPAAKPRRTVG